MHSSSHGSFLHGPKWFRHHAPTAIVLLGVAAFVFVVLGLLAPSGSHEAPQKGAPVAEQTGLSTPPAHGTPAQHESWSQRVRQLTYGVCRSLFFHDEVEHGTARNGLLLVGELLVAASVALAGLGVVFLLSHKIQLWWYTRDGRHIVICGLGERIGQPLARAYRTSTDRKERRRVVAITWEPEAAHRRHAIEALADLGGVIVLGGDASDPALLHAACVAQAERVFVVTSDDARNLAIATAVTDATAHAVRQPHCHVHIDAPERAGLLVDRLQLLTGLRTTETFSMRLQIVRRLVHELFAERAPAPGQIAHVVLLGFGPMGQAIAQELATQAHFLNHRRLRLTIAERNSVAVRGAFLEEFPAFCPEPGASSFDAWDDRLDRWDSLAARPGVRPVAEARSQEFDQACAAGAIEYVCNAEFVELPANHLPGRLVSTLRRRLAACDVGAVIVCTEDMPRNAELALLLQGELASVARPPTVWTWLPKGEAFARLLQPHSGAKASAVAVRAFGLSETLERPMQLAQGLFEEDARKAHAAYIQQRKEAGKYDPADESMRDWNELPARTRDENRNQVANTQHKLAALRAAGFELVPASEPVPADALPVEPVIEALAELEHNRWMADKLLHGFRYAPVTDKPARQHSLLVPYAALAEEAKEQDRAIVRQMMAGRALSRRFPESLSEH